MSPPGPTYHCCAAQTCEIQDEKITDASKNRPISQPARRLTHRSFSTKGTPKVRFLYEQTPSCASPASPLDRFALPGYRHQGPLNVWKQLYTGRITRLLHSNYKGEGAHARRTKKPAAQHSRWASSEMGIRGAHGLASISNGAKQAEQGVPHQLTSPSKSITANVTSSSSDSEKLPDVKSMG